MFKTHDQAATIQKFQHEGLKRLSEIPLEEPQEMMTSKEWTRAVFVSEPKERVLSAFLDKFVHNHKDYFDCPGGCCKTRRVRMLLGPDGECRSVPDFTYFLNKTKLCPAPHWTPQRDVLDEHWWPDVTFIGYAHLISSEAKRLLESVTSSKDNLTAWEKFGDTGWGENATQSFMSRPYNSPHTTDAKSKLLKYYSNCTELYVEEILSRRDFESPYFHFERIEMYHRSKNKTMDLLKECGLL
jgi:hypothetical protein